MTVEKRQDRVLSVECVNLNSKAKKTPNNSCGNTLHYVAYALPVMPVVCLLAPVTIVQGIYAKYYGLPLSALALVLLVARFFDAITDPLIGYCSDRYQQHQGTRKPFMVVGGVSFVISIYHLYVPPAEVTLTYFTLWFMIVYLAWTVFEIPHMAWGSELALSSGDKAKLYSLRAMSASAGLVLFYAVPLFPFFSSTEITPETLKASSILACGLVLVFLIFSMKVTPSGAFKPLEICNRDSASPVPSLKNRLSAFTANRPFMVFLAAYVCLSMASGMWYSLIFLFVDVHLALGDKFAQVFIVAFVLALISTPLWYRLALRFGKKKAWVLGVVLIMASFLFCGTLTPENASTQHLVFLKVLHSLGGGCINALAPASLSEIIDYDTWKSGRQRSGIYFSTYTFATKAVSGLATGAGLGIAALYGFDATATFQNKQAVSGLMLAMSLIPTGLSLLSLGLIFCISMDERRHKIILKRLEAYVGIKTDSDTTR